MFLDGLHDGHDDGARDELVPTKGGGVVVKLDHLHRPSVLDAPLRRLPLLARLAPLRLRSGEEGQDGRWLGGGGLLKVFLLGSFIIFGMFLLDVVGQRSGRAVVGKAVLPPLPVTQPAEHAILVDFVLVLAKLEKSPRQTGRSPLQHLDRVEVDEACFVPARLGPARPDPAASIL